MSLIETIAGLVVPQAAIPLRLLAGARGAANWLCAHPMTGVALLAAALGEVEHHEADKWAALARQRGTALAEIQTANSRAVQQATTAKETKDAYNANLAANGDRDAADLRDRYHAAVVQLAAAQDRARRADLPGDADAAASGDRPGDSAGVPAGAEAAGTALIAPLAISQDDALTCGDNTARLQAVHDWAAALGK